jgi:hypothetical protein
MIDWVLVPQRSARRPYQSRLLFEKAAIPVEPVPQAEDLEQSKKCVAEQWAFFWMMTAITVKYICREDGVFAAQWIEHLHWMIHEIERRMNREPWSYHRGALSKLQPTREKQIESIRELCGRMLELRPRVAEFIGLEPLTPISEISDFLRLVADGMSTTDPGHQS